MCYSSPNVACLMWEGEGNGSVEGMDMDHLRIFLSMNKREFSYRIKIRTEH